MSEFPCLISTEARRMVEISSALLKEGWVLLSDQHRRRPSSADVRKERVCSHLKLSDVPQKQTSIRASVTSNSQFDGQGYSGFCQCLTGCVTRKCTCKDNDRHCGSKCHSNLKKKSQPCQNKEITQQIIV
jgi:hypothetical protein